MPEPREVYTTDDLVIKDNRTFPCQHCGFFYYLLKNFTFRNFVFVTSTGDAQFKVMFFMLGIKKGKGTVPKAK